jgi:Bax protein
VKKAELFFVITSALFFGCAYLYTQPVPVELNIQLTHLDNISKIIEIDDSLVVPMLYDTLLIDQLAPVAIRKKQFINQVLPAILIVRYQMENKSRKVERTIEKIRNNEELNINEAQYADSLMLLFKAKSYENLLIRLKPHPTSLVLAQAAVESGWGSSRFAKEGNNLFGVWTSANDPNVIKSLFDREDQKIYVKKYPTIAASIDHYFLTLGRHRAYLRFRTKRYEEVDVFQLIETLNKYSENGTEYTELLKKIIGWNDLQKYDHYTIDQQYVIKDNRLHQLFQKDFYPIVRNFQRSIIIK